VIGRWAPAGLADLTAGRRQLAAALHDGARPPVIEESAVERLLLAYEELASNALRHGRRPVAVTVSSTITSWLLEVSDAAAEQPPSPAIGRDPAQGGLGLHLVARLCDAHGWTTDGHRKTVWAGISYTCSESPSTARQGAARPRGQHRPDH
jgi:two-component sensor histidine kinase